MMWVIFLAFLVQSNCISSQALTNENVRESRQLKSDECCPCPTAGRIKDNDAMDTNIVPSDCPCRAADSDTASSIFTPTLKAVQSFVRPDKEEPKPLLNPEVGLASSVLETLREATDQEYEEALARDVARSALQEMDSDVDEMPVGASTNVFNNILSPRNSEAADILPEASQNAETRCIHPILSRISEFGYFDIQPQKNLLKDFRLSKPSALSKNNFDMDDSPSNIQETVLPAKNKLLDDIKMKTNLLKSKLTNNKGLLQKMVTEKSFGKTNYNKPHKKIPDWKFLAPLNNLKSSKMFDSNRPPPVAENTKDFSLLNNNILRNNVQNNNKVIPLRKPQQSNKYVTDELSSEVNKFPVLKDGQRFKDTKIDDIDSNADTSILYPVLSVHDDCNLKKENVVQIVATTEKNDSPNVIDANTSNLPISIPSHYSTEILDTLPSPSETIADENQLIDPTDNQPLDDSSLENLRPPTDIQDTTNNLSVENNSEEAEKYIPEIVCTPENSKSEISNFYSASIPDPIMINTDVFNFPSNQNEAGIDYSMNDEINNPNEETSESINNILDKTKERNMNIFPNIRKGLEKTFENVKKINEKWQEKMKLDVQDALQLANVKNNVIMQEEPKLNPVFKPEVLAHNSIPHQSNAKPSNDPNTLSSQELQKMSDSILSLSSVNQNSDPNLGSSIQEVADTKHSMDSTGEPSEIISCLTSAEIYKSRKSEEKPFNNNNQQTTKSSSENQQHFRTINTGNAYIDIKDKPSKSGTPLENISSLNIKEPSIIRSNENEMAAQASEPKPQRNTKIGLDNSRYLKQDFVVQPDNELDEFGRSLLNVNNFFDDVKSSISNVFSKTNENIFRETKDNRDEIDNIYNINKQDNLDFEKPRLSLKKTAKLLKAPEGIQTDTYNIANYKSNLNPYKARVAVPKSFDVKPILSFDVKPIHSLDERSRTANSARTVLPKTYSTNIIDYNSNENVGNENLRSLFRESALNNPNSESTVSSPNILQNSFRSSASKNLGSLKDRTEGTLQNFHKTLGRPLKAVPFKENNSYLNQNIGNDNLFETMANKRNEWNEKLQAINLDLSDRLSSLSHRMADSILPSLYSQPLPQRRITAKGRSNVKNKPGSDYLRRINIPSDIKSALPKSILRQTNNNLSVPKALKKTLMSDNLLDLKKPRVYENSMSPGLTLVKPAMKSPKTDTKTFMPKFKDHKMTSVTATIRPETLTLGLKTPQTTKKASNLIPNKTPPSLEKKSFVSRIQSREPFTLGSENVMSRVSLDKKIDTDKSAVSSDESDQKFDSHFNDIKASKPEEAIKVTLSKLREAFKAKILNRDSNKKDSKDNNLKSHANTDLDIIVPSASENVNKEIDGSLKQNVQYKCSMLCTKDK